MCKHIITLLISFFIADSGISQVLTKKYFTKNHIETEKLDEAYYYREITEAAGEKHFKVVEKYTATDNFKLFGTSTSGQFTHYIGERREFHEDGTLSSEITFSFDNKVIDTAKYFYTNGTEKLTLYFPYEVKQNYTLIKDTLIYSYIDTLGHQRIKDGNGLVLIDVFGEISEGSVNNYKREGDWKGKSRYHDFTFTETYKNGKFISGMSVDKSGNVYSYKSIKVVPEYPNGIHALRTFIESNYNYPIEAIKNKVKGTVIITFVVEKDGNLADVKIANDLGHGTGEAGVDVLKKAKKWKPGLQRGFPVRVAYSIPIRLDFTNK